LREQFTSGLGHDLDPLASIAAEEDADARHAEPGQGRRLHRAVFTNLQRPLVTGDGLILTTENA
jgi:hypothetical protein